MNDNLAYQLDHQRGYAGYFEWRGPDQKQAKREKETGVLIDWLGALYRENYPFSRMTCCEPPLPDFEVEDEAGQRTGIEITELVDRATIEWNQRGPYRIKEYSERQFCNEVGRIITRKDATLRSKAKLICERRYSDMILVIHADEHLLSPGFCRRALADHSSEHATMITGAYLLFPPRRKRDVNDHEAEWCRALGIPLAEGPNMGRLIDRR